MNLIPTDLAPAIMAAFLGAGAQVLECRSPGGGFSEDAIFFLRTTAASCALRGWPRDHWPLARVRERHRWLQHLATAGIPVAVPLRQRQTLDTVVSLGEFDWQLEPWLPGEAVAAADMTPARWAVLMPLLAKMHLASQHYIATDAGAPWFGTGQGPCPAIAERIQLIAGWHSSRVLQLHQQLCRCNNRFAQLGQTILERYAQLAPHIEQELLRLQHVRVPLFPCFRDLWSAHVLFHGDDVTGLIDPTAARREHAGTDLSRLLGSYLGNIDDRWEKALSLYERVRTLSNEDHQLIRVLDRSSVLLSGMTWMERWSDGAISSSQIAEITERMSATAQRLEQL